MLQAWTGLATLGGWMRCLATKYNNRRAVRKSTDRMMRIMFITLWVVGKIRKKVRRLGLRKVSTLLGGVVRANIVLWRGRRRARARKSVAAFVAQHEQAPVLMQFLKFVVYRIRRIQRWFRRICAQKTLALAMMSFQWSAVESELINEKASKRKGAIRDSVSAAVLRGRPVAVIPMSVRLFYIKKWLHVRLLGRQRALERQRPILHGSRETLGRI